MREECRMQIVDLIEEAKADINADPVLQKACAVDISKYCSDVPQGAGRRKNFHIIHVIYFCKLKNKNLFSYLDIMCLQNVLYDDNKPLQVDCFHKLSQRIEMFKNAAKVRYHLLTVIFKNSNCCL